MTVQLFSYNVYHDSTIVQLQYPLTGGVPGENYRPAGSHSYIEQLNTPKIQPEVVNHSYIEQLNIPKIQPEVVNRSTVLCTNDLRLLVES
jgi:hypothetical protein